MSDLNKLANNLRKYLTESDERKPKPYDTKAEVLRTEGNTAWVKIPGGVDETPVQRTNNANPGDTVVVRVSGGRAWIAGNNTSPATDDTRANMAYDVGTAAGVAADAAIGEANRARDAADYATNEAVRAKKAAEQVEDIATDAQKAADSASQSADTAFNQLSFVEDIVGVLQLIAEHGQYEPASENEVQPDKWYFTKEPSGAYAKVNNPESVYHMTTDTVIDVSKTYYTRTGTGTEEDPYTYTEVETPSQAELSTYYEKYYVLVGIDQSIQNYVSSHLVLTSTGLSLRSDNSVYTMDIDPDGIHIKGADGKDVAVYGTDTIIGKTSSFHVKVDSQELGFYEGEQRVAYLNNKQLYITQSVVVKQMDIGIRKTDPDPETGDFGLGQWSWMVHEISGENNLSLKWLG